MHGMLKHFQVIKISLSVYVGSGQCASFYFGLVAGITVLVVDKRPFRKF